MQTKNLSGSMLPASPPWFFCGLIFPGVVMRHDFGSFLQKKRHGLGFIGFCSMEKKGGAYVDAGGIWPLLLLWLLWSMDLARRVSWSSSVSLTTTHFKTVTSSMA